MLENEVKPLVEQFLRDRGLQLSPEKTCITHIDQGFDFLGQNLRKFDGKLLIRPSKKNTHAFLEKVAEARRAESEPSAKLHLIRQLNPVIRGWANYHRHIVASADVPEGGNEFCGKALAVGQTQALRANRRHGSQSILALHRGTTGCLRPTQANEHRRGKPHLVAAGYPSDTKIRRHVKIKAEANPLDPQWRDYFEDRAFFKIVWHSSSRGGVVHRQFSGSAHAGLCNGLSRMKGNFHVRF